MSAAAERFRIEALASRHDPSGFSSGVEPLDRYLWTQAGQDARRRVASCFVLVSEGDDIIAGYYTLSATSVSLTDLPSNLAKRLPRYPMIPATLMGRLAIDTRHRGRRLGELLLFDAFSRTLRSEIASFAFVVDAKDEHAWTFYGHYRFLPLIGRRLYLPVGEIAKLFL
ncbi:MAG: GNAT family N-acetyltransferase [Proteobacteria bacterium]|nr:GNAT family N-acetyltransferase [Pseudomonadota bacterium]MBI3498471.1 GNAT family N-acetyltransferase [Pseudomonadota bacterium]